MLRFIGSALAISLLQFFMPSPSAAVPEGIVLTWPGGGTGTVAFDGTIHAKKGLGCEWCHTAGLFGLKKGVDKMTMAEMNRGKFCGACHNGKKAFSTSDSEKCLKCHQGKKGR